MNKNIIIRTILIIMIIINCAIIFNFSSQQSEKSSGTSGRVVNTIIETNPKTKNLEIQKKQEIKDKITKPIRKTAHFTVYTCLGMLLFLCAQTFKSSKMKRFLCSWALGVIYACTDEIHQKFVQGRSSEITDVCIDGLGVLFGIVIATVLIKLICTILKKTVEK